MDEETAVWRDQAIEWQQRAVDLAGQLAVSNAENDRLRAVMDDYLSTLVRGLDASPDERQTALDHLAQAVNWRSGQLDVSREGATDADE